VLSLYEPDWTGGHSVTPIAVEDMGNGTAKILIYDNNFPDEVKAIEVNKTANTWKYITSINPKKPPKVYSGNASTHNLEVSSLSSRLGTQKCQFCNERNVTNPQESQAVQSGEVLIQVWLFGDAHLLITDAIGQRIGYLPSGEFVNEIPNASAKFFKTLEAPLTKEPMYSIPATPTSQKLSIKIDGTGLLNEGYQNLMITGPCFNIGAQKIWLEPGETDQMSVTWSPYCDNARIEYRTTSKSKTVDLIVSLKSKDADHEFVVRGAKVTRSGALIVELDTCKFCFITEGNSDPGKAQLMMRRVNDPGEQFFANEGLLLLEGDAVCLDFCNWQGEGSSLPAEVKRSDGTTETVTLADNPALHQDYYENPTLPTPETPSTVTTPPKEETEIPSGATYCSKTGQWEV